MADLQQGNRTTGIAGTSGTRGAGLGPRHLLGPEVSRRFDFARWRRPAWARASSAQTSSAGASSAGASSAPPDMATTGRGQVLPSLTAGSVASSASAFVAVVGRSLAERAAAGQRLGLLAAGLPWPLRPPEDYLPIAGERRHFRVSVSAAERQARSWAEIEQRMKGVAATRPARRPPAVLPRATSRADQSRVGLGTGPAGAARRMASQPVFVSHPAEVRAAGGMRSGHDRPGTAARWR